MSDAAPTAKRATLLVVDDTPQNLSLMSDLLENLYAVKLAPSGARALKIAATHPLDLILLDVMMPEMDGYEVCRALKGNPDTQDIPVIFLSAMDAMEDEEKGLLAGAVDYITKPISPPILLARVRNQLALKEVADKLREQNHLLEQEKVRGHELLQKLKQASDKMLEHNRLLKQEQLRARELLHIFDNGNPAQEKLNMVWDKLRQFPPNESLMEDLYVVALEFERNHQFDKSETVFRHMAKFNPKFRDLESRLTQATALSNNSLTVDHAPRSPEKTGILADSPGKLTLGRYQIDRELGKGAMGTVYLGTDPKIGRVVAIKTIALAKEFGTDKLNDIKERFFREAESAGHLLHPNIVAIYDVGEERDLAYIAMEFLKGKDLTGYTKPGNLLDLDKVLSIVERVAEALAFAHNNDVVHRDIKPGNIVYEPVSDSVKVADFGIASITNSYKADAGMVLGTPSYMSPEQIAGKVIDGRSDLYSLGVMLYLLASGHLPFQAESLSQLMFKIANEPHADVRTHNAELPDCVAMLINKALSKDPEQRFQNGELMARTMSVCRRSISVFTK
jgi:CheY-like chemotaxis protein/tRNA A-37 threonylcarbamoyl transferase component Bud32